MIDDIMWGINKNNLQKLEPIFRNNYEQPIIK